MRPANAAVALALLLACAGAGAAQRDDDVPAVEVNGLKNPQMKSYRAVVAGLDAFEEPVAATYRVAAIKWGYKPMARAAAFFETNRVRYAPDSVLRFRLPAQVRDAPDMQAVQLLGADYSEAVALDEHKLFALPKLPGGAAGDAAIVVDGYFNKGTYLPIPEVRTATLAPNTVRVGDVRLACRTMVAYIRAYKMTWNLVLGSMSALSLDICGLNASPYAVKAPIAYNKVTWMVGDKVVKVEALRSVRREFEVPVGDPAIADDTLLAFELAPASGS